MNKILDLIFEDVKNENETKKTAVTLRISALCVQRSWTTLAGVSPVTVIASEPCS